MSKLTVLDHVSTYKRKTLEEAVTVAIPILRGNAIIGKLLPVGEWILNDVEKIQLICDWRSKTMRMFLTQFENSFSLAKNYLEKVPIKSPDRILFLILDEQDRLIGHIGLANINKDSCEIDNMMRGEAGGDTQLMTAAEQTLLDWCFTQLHVSLCTVVVLSYNWLAQMLHESVGFSEIGRYPLLKKETNGIISHEIVEESHSNVQYRSVLMELKATKFKIN